MDNIVMTSDHEMVNNFLFNCMTQAEQALDGQDPGRMAEALRSILQGAHELHRWQAQRPAAALPSAPGSAQRPPSAKAG
jgi:hypothetical protein